MVTAHCPAVFTICYQLLQDDWIGMVVCAAVFVLATLALFFTFGRGRRPESYAVSATVPSSLPATDYDSLALPQMICSEQL
jgi:hypothetical protein